VLVKRLNLSYDAVVLVVVGGTVVVVVEGVVVVEEVDVVVVSTFITGAFLNVLILMSSL
jgi:hypothetical protein